MRRFFVADVNATGELRALAVYRNEQLEQIPGAGELFRFPSRCEGRGVGGRVKANRRPAGGVQQDW